MLRWVDFGAQGVGWPGMVESVMMGECAEIHVWGGRNWSSIKSAMSPGFPRFEGKSGILVKLAHGFGGGGSHHSCTVSRLKFSCCTAGDGGLLFHVCGENKVIEEGCSVWLPLVNAGRRS